MARDYLIFDLDGTISDPAPGILRSINFALSRYGYAEVDERRVAECIGPPIDEVFRELTRNASRERIVALVARYRARYADVGFSESELYTGVVRAVAGLAESESPLAVCTSKRADFAERILDMFGLRDCFRFVAGARSEWPRLISLRSFSRMGSSVPARS
ncbi:MAG: HAD hydrolase-like protein [Pseudomonadota bacterium]